MQRLTYSQTMYEHAQRTFYHGFALCSNGLTRTDDYLSSVRNDPTIDRIYDSPEGYQSTSAKSPSGVLHLYGCTPDCHRRSRSPGPIGRDKGEKS